jgi:radical SAM superfamily enzyme YgiQ (UPF0313 family)
MNVLFVYSLDEIQSEKKPLRSPEQMHFGISYISSLLKENRHNCRLIILSRALDKKNRKIIDEYLKEFYPKLICFTSVTTQYRFIAEMAKYIKKKYPDIFLLIGGPHASLNPEKVIINDFDALCIGEGEYPVLELVSTIEKGKKPPHIQNLWIKKDEKIEKNSTRPFLQDLNKLPFPDREMWVEWIDKQSNSRNAILLGRGCPFNCSYCCNHSFKKLASKNYVRLRSPQNIIGEIKEIIKSSSKEIEIYLEVESFNVNEKWAFELCSELENLNKNLKYPISYGVNIRILPNRDLDNLFAVCKKANFKFINIGLESGSERIRKQILRRDYSNEDVTKTVKLAKKYGLEVSLYNMIGLPTETLEDFKDTIRVNRDCLPDGLFTSIFFPYPGTDLYSLCEKEGLLKKELDPEMERSKAVLDLPKFNKKQIQKSYIWFDYCVYRGHRPLYKLLLTVLLTKIRTNLTLDYSYRKITHLIFLKWLKNALKKVLKL